MKIKIDLELTNNEKSTLFKIVGIAMHHAETSSLQVLKTKALMAAAFAADHIQLNRQVTFNPELLNVLPEFADKYIGLVKNYISQVQSLVGMLLGISGKLVTVDRLDEEGNPVTEPSKNVADTDTEEEQGGASSDMFRLMVAIATERSRLRRLAPGCEVTRPIPQEVDSNSTHRFGYRLGNEKVMYESVEDALRDIRRFVYIMDKEDSNA